MTEVAKILTSALRRGAAVRPPVAGFPYLAEALRSAGFEHVICDLAGGSMLYRNSKGAAVTRVPAQVTETTVVPEWNEAAVVAAIQSDQAGESTFPDFLSACWSAGTVGYEVDLSSRTCTYWAANPADRYIEAYSAVVLQTASTKSE